MHKVFLGIGGNLGNKQANFEKVFELIEKDLGKVIEHSSIYETPAWGFHSEEVFWNQVLLIETTLSAHAILENIKHIEAAFDRKRGKERYSSRQMDVDILYYNQDFFDDEHLVIPHPRIHERKFVLVPLCEIAPDFKHPLMRLNHVSLLENCLDKSIIKKVAID
jgi:2-amino-4-hydroxy-6-hydroxymethyldihydropteridine diphosphokinase